MLLGLAKGKVGDLVFYRDGGEQRTRTRVIPKNPRTPAQMMQRAKIANVSALYRALAAVLSSSFTNRPSNQSGYNAFAANAIGLAPYQTKQMAAADVVLPQPCQVSKGTISSLPFELSEGDDGRLFGIDVDGGLDGSSTIGAVSQSLLSRYPTLQENDRIVSVVLRFTPAADEVNGVERYTTELRVNTFEVNSAGVEIMNNTEFVVNDSVFSASALDSQFDGYTQMAAYIVCRDGAGGALQCSTEYFQLSTLAQTLYDGYRTQQAINDAVQSYMAGSESILK